MQMHVNVLCGCVIKTNIVLHCEAGRVIDRITQLLEESEMSVGFSFPTPF